MPPEAQSTKGLYEVVRNPQPRAVVVHCSDPRLQAAFERFVEQELGLKKGDYIPLVIGGGAGVLAHPAQLPKEFKFLRDRFEFYREVFPTARRIVLINHEECHYYDSIKEKVYTFIGKKWKGATEHAREDMSLIAHAFVHLLAHIGYTVELYYAKFADEQHTRVKFEKVLS